MATTTVATGAAQTVKKFLEKLLASEVEKKMSSKQFMGNSADYAIQKLDALAKGKGDAVNFQIRFKLSGQGVTGDNTLEGNEETITVSNASVVIDQLRNAAGKHSRMTAKRTYVDYTTDTIDLLSVWFAEWCDEALFQYLSGVRGTNDTSGKFAASWNGHAGNTLATPDANHLRYCTDTGLSSTIGDMNDTFDVLHLDLANVLIKELQNTSGNAGMRKVRFGSRPKFILMLSPRQRTHMMQTNASNLFEKINIGKIQGGNTTDYIFDDGIDYTDFAIYENVNVRRIATADYTGIDSGMASVHRALILGAQAAVVAYGDSNGGFDNIQVDTETFDYGNMTAYAGSAILGMRKVTFNDPAGTARDLGVYCLDSQAEV